MAKKSKPDFTKGAGKAAPSDAASQPSRYRLLARQTTAVTISAPQPFSISTTELPKVALRPVHKDPAEQMQFGGTDVVIEFETEEADMLRAAQVGLELVDDVLAAISLHAAVRFRETALLQVLETTPEVEERRLLVPLQIGMVGSDKDIGADTIDFVRKAVLHWDNLDTGHRLRRAARKYAQGLAESKATDAFQLAYVGLEALEKPLAIELGIPPGVEVMTGKCKECGATYNYNKTTLAAVRSYVTGTAHEGGATEERRKDWKECSAVRNDLAHGLKDLSEIEGRAHRFLPAIFHYLHDACAHLTHAHELESHSYRFAWQRQLLLLGLVKNYVLGPLEDFDLLFGVRPIRWAKDDTYGMVPEFAIDNSKAVDVGLIARSLSKPLSEATEDDLEPFQIQPQKVPGKTEGGAEQAPAPEGDSPQDPTEGHRPETW